MGTDALVRSTDVADPEKYGYDNYAGPVGPGHAMRETLAARGFKSVAADGFGAPGVVVSWTTGFSGAEFAAKTSCWRRAAHARRLRRADFRMRLGLFGIDKLQNRPLRETPRYPRRYGRGIVA